MAMGHRLTPAVSQGILGHNGINHVSVNTDTMFLRKEVMHTNIHPPHCLPLNTRLLPVWDKHASRYESPSDPHTMKWEAGLVRTAVCPDQAQPQWEEILHRSATTGPSGKPSGSLVLAQENTQHFDLGR